MYGSLTNTSAWSTQYWGALADSTLLGAGCPVAQSTLPAKYQARPTLPQVNCICAASICTLDMAARPCKLREELFGSFKLLHA